MYGIVQLVTDVILKRCTLLFVLPVSFGFIAEVGPVKICQYTWGKECNDHN